MSSRLDRLFLLLDTASSPLTRKAAALQLGEVQKLHPHELHNLLAKVKKYLYSNSWDTRIAAGQAVEAIISNVSVWNPPCSQDADGRDVLSSNSMCAGRLKLSDFDINRVIQNGTNTLLASEGIEFDESYSVSETTLKDKLAKQRQLLNMQLGLTCSMPLGMETDGFVSAEDLKPNNTSACSVLVENKRNLSDAYQAEISQLSCGTSFSRGSKGKQKRSKSYTTQTSKDVSFDSDSMPPSKKRCGVPVDYYSASDSGISDAGSDSANLWEESKEWPFESFCDELVQDLFNSAWVVRHGSATALREIIKLHGRGAGKTADATSDQLELLNQIWLEDMSLRLTCVLALDKFGDFISDQVIAPVRETCAQALGAVVNIMSPASVEAILLILLQLLQRPEWETRHGGLLGLKYCLAVRKDMQRTMIPLVFDAVCSGLKDCVDDVSAVAAAALVPVTDIVVSVLSLKLSSITVSLWDALLDLDDLTASTSSILELLASLLSFPCVDSSQTALVPLDQLVPRLWPFLGHNSSGVRKSVLQTLATLTSSKSPQACDIWVPKILPTALRLLYQRVLVESHCDIHDLFLKVWKNMLSCSPLPFIVSSTFPFLSYWLSMLMQQSNVPIDPSTNTAWLNIHCKLKEKPMPRNRKFDSHEKDIQEYFFIGGSEVYGETSKQREISVIRAKTMGSKFLGVLCSLITKATFINDTSPEEEKPIDAFEKLLMFHLNNRSAHQRFAISLVLSQWAESDKDNCCPLSVKQHCLQCLNESIYYDEIAVSFTKLQQECKDFIAFLKHYKFSLDPFYTSGSVFTFEQISHLATEIYPSLKGSVKLRPKELENLEEKQKSLLQNVEQSSHDQMALTTMVQAAIAGALVSLKFLPEKLNPVIRPLMESIKHEENEFLQKMAASHLVYLMELCLQRTNCPNAKILKNITNFLRVDPIPNQSAVVQNNISNKNSDNKAGTEEKVIISLINMQKSAEKIGLRRCNSSAKKISDAVLDDVSNSENEIKLRKRGAKFVLTEAVKHFADTLPEKLPTLWETIFNPLSDHVITDKQDTADAVNEDSTQNLICCLTVMEVVASSFHETLHSKLKEKLPYLNLCLDNPNSKVRHMTARCLGVLSRVITVEVMDLVLDHVLIKLGATDSDVQRQGAVETIHCIIEELELEIVPYIVLLIVPLLGRMSDQNDDARLLATHCFAALIKLMPLEGGIKDPINLHPRLVDRKLKERRFLEQLMNPKKLEPYKIPTCINAELRSYQQEGVNWLAFLNQYKLHGILCDDMGLGKTLQSICILAGDHELREAQYRDTKAADCKPLPSLVVCPPTLTGHWVYEVEKFVKRDFLKPLHYTGPPTERIRLRSKSKKHNLIIASYDIVRNDIDFFGSIHWNYCILDEGHVIKNGKTKLSKAIKLLSANHRLILTGTPIQNNVLELWSLFDFLIPGFLGTEKQFTARYSKPILLSRDAKASSKEQEAGVLAMESLHRQVLPFLLRRMKEDVLQDLPPKIIQDYYCELSALQVQLYEDFAKSRVKQSVEDSLCGSEASSGNQGSAHVFQALQYLRKVCNHPKLVLTSKHPEYENVAEQLKKQNSNLQDVQHATKLCALKQLLQDCGIGALPSGVSNTQNEPAPVVNQHRALIFCQLKSMLDILERDLFQTLMPTVSYLRLDGSIPPGNRHAVVQRFNSDPSLDVLLLTTLVGGLGLNLTGADTVIFVEHDWNPMKDLQAMDRAHRIGQKKVVNVYRLITRGTLEEKIMGLQKFKLSIANSVINQENSSLQNMGTDQLLDLFSLDYKGQKVSSKSEMSAQDKGKGIKSALENLPELWDANQYETEYDLDNFLQSMRKSE